MRTLRLTRHRVRAVVTMVLAASLLAASASACAELERPPAYSPSPTVTLAIGEGPASEERPDEEATAQAVDDFGLSTPPNFVPALLVPANTGLLQVGNGPVRPLEALGNRTLTAAYDDLVGGVVVEERGIGVTYFPAQGEPELLTDNAAALLDDGWSALLDVGYWDGAPRAFLRVDERRVDRIQLVAERVDDEPERLEHIQLDPDEVLVDFSASRGIQAVIVQDDACGDLRFYGSDGQPLSLTGPEPPECTFPGRPSFGSVAVSPDGDAVAYTIVSYRGDGIEAGTDLVVRELSSSQPFFPYRIGESLDRITSLTYDGTRVAYVLTSVDDADQTPSTITLINLTDPAPTPIDLGGPERTGSVAFTRNPILLGG